MSGVYSRYVVASWGTVILVRNTSCGMVFAILIVMGHWPFRAWPVSSRRNESSARGMRTGPGGSGGFPILGRTVLTRKKRSSWTRPSWSTISAVVLGAVASVGYVGALLISPIANVVIIYSSAPVMAAAINVIVFREYATPRVLASSMMAFVGVLVIFVHSSGGTSTLSGDALAVLMTAATGGVMIVMERDPSIDVKIVTFFICAITAPCGLPLLRVSDLTTTNVMLLFIYGLSGGLAFVCLMRGARLLSPVEAGLISTVEVVLAPLWVYAAFGEIPSLNTVLGGVIILMAVVTHLISTTPFKGR